MSIPELLAESARCHEKRPALWYHTGERFESVAYAALIAAVAAMGEKLRLRGVGPDCRVAVWIEDRFTWGVAYLAVLWSGATAVPIDPLLTHTEIAGIVREAEAAFVLSDGSGEGDFTTLAAIIPLADIWAGFAEGAPDEIPAVPVIDPAQLASILFTSGTTGSAKGVMLTHANLVSDVLAIRERNLCGPEDILLSVLPIHHAFECTVGFLYPLAIGAQVAYARSLKSNEIIADLRTSQATLILGVPLLFEKIGAAIQRRVGQAPWMRRRLFASLLALSRGARRLGYRGAGRPLFSSVRQRAGLGSLRLLGAGGAALPPEVGEFFDTIGIPIVQGYGLSETAPMVTVNRPGAHRYETVGPPLPGVDLTIRDPKPDGTGEIAVRGPMVMQGYWRRPEETAKVLQNGWLLTGDLGVIDADGHLRIVGRLKNVIISGAGKNIYPEEIEVLLDSRPEIAESLVYGWERPGKIGEAVAAILVPDREWFHENAPDALNDETKMKRAIGAAVETVCHALASYKRVVDWTIRNEPFERTSTKKIKRFLALGAANRPPTTSAKGRVA